MYIGDYKITKREAISSVVIVCLMMVVGFFISTWISDRIAQKNEVFYKAVKINGDANMFSYGIKTGVGNVLAYGTVTAREPVSLPELVGDYYSVSKITERYTRHVRTVVVSLGNGKTTTRTEVYYTWDTVSSDEYKTDTIEFLGQVMPSTDIKLNNDQILELTKENVSSKNQAQIYGNYIYKNRFVFSSVGDIRYYYVVIPTSTNGTLLATLKAGEFKALGALYVDQTPQQVVDDIAYGEGIPIIIFWVFWSLITVGSAIGFVCMENKWLED